MRRDPRAALFFPPLAVRYDPRANWLLVVPVVVAVLLVAMSAWVARTARWWVVILVAFAAAAGWAVALAQADGVAGLTGDANYLHDVAFVRHPGAFLSGFVVNIAHYTQHVRAHPPGYMALLWAMRRIGLGGAGWEAAAVIAAGAAAVPAALFFVRELAGERTARSAAPFLVLAPTAIWMATSADGFFMGVTAWSVAAIVLSTGRSGRRSDVLAALGGVLFGAGLFLSYGAALVGLVPVAIAAARRRLRPLIVAAAGIAAVGAVFAAAGFWWFHGLQATLNQYAMSAAQFRPQSAFWLIDLGAFAVAVGPTTAVALARLRQRWIWLAVGAALLGVVLADLSGFSKGEVERIWLPFAPWILVASASLDGDRPQGRPWLAAQAAACLWLQIFVRGP
jgi:methylthioxylose transferase